MNSELKNLKREFSDLVRLRWNLAWLRSLQFTSNLWSRATSFFIMVIIMTITVLFATMTAALYIHELTGSIVQAFGWVSIFWAVVFIILLTTRKAILRPMLRNRFIKMVSEESSLYIEEEKEKDDQK